MYDQGNSFGMNVAAFMSMLYERYQNSGSVATAQGYDNIACNIAIYADFAFYLAEREGERAALRYCEHLNDILIAAGSDDRAGPVFLAQARLFDRIGKAMSRDLFAIEAAEAFAHSGHLKEAEMALTLVAA